MTSRSVHSSRGSAVSTSPSSTSPEDAFSGRPRSMSTDAPSSDDTGPESSATATSDRSGTERPKSTSSAEDSSAPRSPMPGHAEGWPDASVGPCGASTLGSLAIYDPDSRSWKTSQRSLLEDSTKFSETLPPSGSMRSGRLYPRQKSGHRMGEIGSGSWPTPTAVDYGSSQNGSNSSRPLAGTPSMQTIVRRGMGLWATPVAAEATHNASEGRNNLTHQVRNWATPLASDTHPKVQGEADGRPKP